MALRDELAHLGNRSESAVISGPDGRAVSYREISGSQNAADTLCELSRDLDQFVISAEMMMRGQCSVLMDGGVIALSQSYQVFQPVVPLQSIDVVDVMPRSEFTVCCLPYQYVFRPIGLRLRPDHHVATGVDVSTSSPVGVLRAALLGSGAMLRKVTNWKSSIDTALRARDRSDRRGVPASAFAISAWWPPIAWWRNTLRLTRSAVVVRAREVCTDELRSSIGVLLAPRSKWQATSTGTRDSAIPRSFRSMLGAANHALVYHNRAGGALRLQ